MLLVGSCLGPKRRSNRLDNSMSKSTYYSVLLLPSNDAIWSKISFDFFTLFVVKMKISPDQFFGLMPLCLVLVSIHKHVEIYMCPFWVSYSRKLFGLRCFILKECNFNSVCKTKKSNQSSIISRLKMTSSTVRFIL